MHRDNFIEEYQKIKSGQEEGAVAIIVRREAPSSGKPGDKAIITKNGEVKGWIGGGCTKGIAIKESLEAIKEQTPRLVRIQPGMNIPDQPGVKNYKMTCMSGGAVEIYIEPIISTYNLKIFGRSHIAKALCNIGSAAGFEVTVISDLPDDDMFGAAAHRQTLKDYQAVASPGDFMVVCTQGENDMAGLLAAIRSNPRYLAFVASRKKAQAIFADLRLEGVGSEDLARIKTPAGLDIQAKTPEEVAISILAEIVKEKRSAQQTDQESSPGMIAKLSEESDLYINPVCKIPVQKSTAKHILEYKGEKVYFCCDGCKNSFEKAPAKFMATIS